MKHVKNYSEFNESWRQIKAWFRIPEILLEVILNKIIDYIPRIGIKYDILSAKVDTESSMNSRVLKDDPIKLTLNDITNDKVRKTLKMSGILNKWNIYVFDREHEKRQPIYITKDELKKGDVIYTERMSDGDIDPIYRLKNKRKFRKLGKEIHELEPQFWVVVAKHTEEHDKMKEERDKRYEKKQKRELEKLVNKCIKEDNFISRSSSIYKTWNYDPIIFKVVQNDRVDLMQKIIDSIKDDPDYLKKVLNTEVDSEGWVSRGSRNLLDEAKSDEMRELIKKYI